MHLHSRTKISRYRAKPKGAALVLTVLLAAVAASIALAMVSQTLSSSRTEQLRNSGSTARQDTYSMLTQFEIALRSRPSIYLEKVLENEPDRICISNPSKPRYAQGTVWPAACGPVWEYANSSNSKILKITPPSSENPNLKVDTLSKIGETIYALTATFKTKGAGTFTVWTNSDLILDSTSSPSNESILNGVLYSTKTITLPSQDSTVNIQNSQIIAEKGYTGTSTTNTRLYSGQSGALKSAREVIPSPLTLSQLRSDTLHLPSLACAANNSLFEYKNKLASATLCFKAGQVLIKTNGEEVTIGSDIGSYLLQPSPTVADELTIYKSTQILSTKDCIIDCNLPVIASSLSDTYLGNQASWGSPLGTFKVPHSGLIFFEKDTFIGLCGSGYASPNGVCQTINGNLPGMTIEKNITVITGIATDPKNIILGSPIYSSLGKKIGLIASNSLIIPFFARPPQSDLNLEIAAIALGYGIDVNTYPTFRTYPFELSKNSETDINFANALEIKGSIYAPYFDFKLNTTNSTSLLADMDLLKTPPPYLPGFNIGVTRASTRNLTPDEIASLT